MAGVAGIEFGSGWYERLLSFRENPKLFFDSRKISKGAFCLDILKGLYSDPVGVQYKIHLLLLLQEYSSFLLTDVDLAEQVICSLQNLYHTLKNSEDKKLFKSQTLLSLTTILLSCDNLVTSEDQQFSKLLKDTKAVLLSASLSRQKDHVLEFMSCQCLEEIEEFYPGILIDDIEKLWTFCQSCSSPSFQSYALLLSSCLKHLTELQKKKNVESNDSASTDLEASSAVENEIPVLSICAYLIDVLPLMTQACVSAVLRNLAVVVRNNTEIQAVVLKPWIPRLIVSSNVLYFHLAFDLLKIFGDELFTSQEEQMLLYHLTSCANHPSINSSCRLLYLDWLGSSVIYKDVFSSNTSLSSTDFLFHFPFDGRLEQQQKLKLLAHYITSKRKTNKCVQLLMNALSGLKQSALLPTGLKASTSLFRVLFLYCSLHSSEILMSEVKKLILFLVTTSPHLASHCMSFLYCVKVNFEGRPLESGSDYAKLCEDVLSKLVDHVISLPVKQFLSHVYDYFSMLSAAVTEDPSVCKPTAVLRCLQNVVSQASVSEKDEWMFGNSVLTICHSLLKSQSVHLFCYDLCELLLVVLKNISDVDVKLRAKTYYATVTFLSESKVKALFQNDTYCKTTDDSLSSFIAGGKHLFRFRNTIQQIQKPVLQLTRVKKQVVPPSNETTDASSGEDRKGVFDVYKEFVSSESFQPIVQVPFILKHVKGCDEEFSTLYAIVIKIVTSPVPSNAIDIEVPVLMESESEGILVNAEFTPSCPCPVTLAFIAEFTSSDGCSFICDLSSVTLEFEDLFIPISTPRSASPLQSSWKRVLFEEMWSHIRTEAGKGIGLSSGCTSGMKLDVNVEDLTEFVMENWAPFILSKPPESAAFCVAVFLSPSCHLLMKINSINNAIFVHILSDDWTILPWVSLYLKNLEVNFTIRPRDPKL